MRWNRLTLAGVVAVLALSIAACDGTGNDRTQPTAPAGYVSPAMRGPEIPKEGEQGYGNESNGGETQPGEAAPTGEAK